MSEAASTGSTATATAASSTASNPSQSTASQTTTQQANQTSEQSQQGQQNQSQAEALEEIKVGSATMKVSKEIAQVIKNLERGFQTKAQEAAQERRLAQLARENPKEFFRVTGKDPYDFAESLLAEKYADMQLSPEEKAQKEKLARLEQFEKQESSTKNQIIEAIKKEFGGIPQGAENATKEQLINYYRQQKHVYSQQATTLDQEIGNAFKDSGLAPDRHLLAKVAFEMSSALKRGKSLSAKQAIDKVSKEYFAGAKETLGKMDVQRIREILGDEFLEKIRKHDLDQVTAQAASKFGQNQMSQGVQPSSQQSKPYLTETEWRAKYR